MGNKADVEPSYVYSLANIREIQCSIVDRHVDRIRAGGKHTSGSRRARLIAALLSLESGDSITEERTLHILNFATRIVDEVTKTKSSTPKQNA